jgi:outer membrane protein assembly factor BamB
MRHHAFVRGTFVSLTGLCLAASGTGCVQRDDAPVEVTSAALQAQAASGKIDWLQFNGDARHYGNNTLETQITPQNVGSLAKLFTVTLPAKTDSAVSVLTNVSTAQGVRDLAFVLTGDGHTMALDAQTGATIWSQSVPNNLPDGGGPNVESMRSTPAIDPSRSWVYAYGWDGYIHKYAVATGAEATTGGWPELLTLKPDQEHGAPGISIATVGSTSYLYMSAGGYAFDTGEYQGHLVTVNLSTGTQNVFNALCSDQTVQLAHAPATPSCAYTGGGIWGRSGAIYDSDTGHTYIATGNGTGGKQGSSFSPANHVWAMSLLALNPDGTGNAASHNDPLDSYTPAAWATLTGKDLDLGSCSPLIIPGGTSKYPHIVVQTGKDAMLRIINLDNMGANNAACASTHTGCEVYSTTLQTGGEVQNAMALWQNPADGTYWIYVASPAKGLNAYQFASDASGNPSLTFKWDIAIGGSSPFVANNVVYWMTSTGTSTGKIQALDPTTGAQLWADTSIANVHWESPVVVNGILYVNDHAGNLTAYSTSCVPSCTGKTCGANGCGGVCGVCGSGTTCNASGTCVACVPSCTGKTCGDDGCGGVCGTCATGTTCGAAGTCTAATFPVSINFQTATAPTYPGYLKDTGLAYGDRGNGYTYGWSADISAGMRQRNAASSPDERYDTLAQPQQTGSATFNLAVPPGLYSVRVVAGDPSYINSVYNITAEGTTVVSGTPTTATHWFDGTVTVQVNDGNLTIGNGTGSSNNKIDFIVVSAAAQPTTWHYVYSTYFAGTTLAATPGHCAECHAPPGSASSIVPLRADETSFYADLISAGLVDPTNPSASMLGNPNGSPLSWFASGGGSMPLDEAGPNPAAIAAVQGWLNAGAPGPGVAIPFTVSDEYVPSGYYGGTTASINAITMTNTAAACKAPRVTGALGDCYAATWTPPTTTDYAGVFWQSPANNWGAQPCKAIAPGATAVTFVAAGKSGGESVAFAAGGINLTPTASAPYGDSFTATTNATLTTAWQPFSITLPSGYTNVCGGFSWNLTATSTQPVSFYVDNVQWVHAVACTPSCSGKTCGPDGCGGTCGTCAAGTTCNAAGTCVANTTFSVSINFQTAAAPAYAGYLADTGLVYGARGNGQTYGWSADISAAMRWRKSASSPDERYDTLAQIPKGTTTFNLAVPAGTYSVRAVAGDPSYIDSVYAITAEGTTLVSGTPSTATHWFDNTITVQVTDGQLTIANGAGSSNNKLDFLIVNKL